MPPALLIGIVILIVLVLIVTVISIRRQNADVVGERLERYSGFNVLEIEETEKPQEKRPSALTVQVDKAIEGRKFAQTAREELARADLKLTPAEYLGAHVLSSVGMGLVAYFILFPGTLVMAILAAGVGIFLPRFYVSNRKSGRLHKFESQLPDILGLWVNSLRAGFSTLQSLEAISREAPEPSAKEFRRVVREVQLGLPQEDALQHLLDRMPSEDLDLVITAVNIQREVGGNLAEILEIISHTIRERIKLKGEIRVLTSQGRITGYVIGGLPIVLSLFLMLVNPSYMGNLFNDHFCGWPMIAIGLGLIGTGTAVIQRIVDIDI
jgi:tight adherence protein B